MKFYALIFSLFTLTSCGYVIDWVEQLIERNRELIDRVEDFQKKYGSVEKLIEAGVLDAITQSQELDFKEVLDLVNEEEDLCIKLRDADIEIPESMEEIRQKFDLDSTEGQVQCNIAKGIAKTTFKTACNHTEDQLLAKAEDILRQQTKYEGLTLDKEQMRSYIQDLTKHCE